MNELLKLLVSIYNHGYMAEHDATVEGCFVNILPSEMNLYHEDIVNELVADLLTQEARDE